MLPLPGFMIGITLNCRFQSGQWEAPADKRVWGEMDWNASSASLLQGTVVLLWLVSVSPSSKAQLSLDSTCTLLLLPSQAVGGKWPLCWLVQVGLLNISCWFLYPFTYLYMLIKLSLKIPAGRAFVCLWRSWFYTQEWWKSIAFHAFILKYCPFKQCHSVHFQVSLGKLFVHNVTKKW